MERKAVIAADSSANLFSAKDAEYVSVPLRIITDVKEYTDDEKLDVPGMLNDLKHYKGKSSTACPSVGDWLKAFGDADEGNVLSQVIVLQTCRWSSVCTFLQA